MPHSPAPLDSLAEDLFQALAGTFPVCCASDEFYYFPQVVSAARDWSRWDDFSAHAVDATTARLASAEQAFAALAAPSGDRDESRDARALARCCRTLREQLTEARFHQRQASFHLTVANVGLGEALQSGEPNAWEGRVGGLGPFLDSAGRVLADVPDPGREVGLKMLRGLREWLRLLAASRPVPDAVARAMDRFEDSLCRARVDRSFRLPDDLFERVVRDHMACGVSVGEAMAEIEEEIAAMRGVLKGDAPSALRRIALPFAGRNALDFCRDEASRLEAKCVGAGLIPADLARAAALRVQPVPPSLLPVRAAAAYSASAGHPPRGGTFFVHPEEAGGAAGSVPAELRATVAHETFPGHHLLDVSRWNLDRPLRRALELPVFSEGWACFAEQAALAAGWLDLPADGRILAARRLRRAVRGRVDLGLQSGRLTLDAAAADLLEAGVPPRAAREAAGKYALRPGYQVCYTLGQRSLERLFERYGGGDYAAFGRVILAAGELTFDELERVLGNEV